MRILLINLAFQCVRVNQASTLIKGNMNVVALNLFTSL